MYIVKNAIRSIGRSKGRNILVGIIVLVIAISACIGLSIRQAAQSAKEETLSDMSVTATISVDRQSMMGGMMGGMPSGVGGSFDKDAFAEMMGGTSALTLDEYQKYAAAASVKDFYYTVTASLNGSDNIEAVSTDTSSSSDSNDSFGGGFGGGFGGRPSMGMSSGDFSITGYSSDTAMTSFIDGTIKVTDGAVFTEGTASYDCIISEELATYNGLAVGSVITLTNPQNEEEAYELTVVGIYSDSSSNEGFSMMRGSDPANNIYMSYTALNAIIEASEEVSTTVTDENTGMETETALVGTLSGTYVFATADDYYKFEEEARTLGLSDTYSISSGDLTAFENSLVPLNTLGDMAFWFLIIILIIGAVILVVLNIFNIRERKYEIGVLMAIGMKKGKVAMQFLTEVFVVTLAAVIIGIGVGAVSAVPVTNALLANQIESSQGQADKITESFGRGEMPDMGNMGGCGGGMGGMQPPSDNKFEAIGNIFGEDAANYVSEVNSAMNLTVVLQMLGIAILLTLVAGAVSMLFVMRYEPLKILSNRD